MPHTIHTRRVCQGTGRDALRGHSTHDLQYQRWYAHATHTHNVRVRPDARESGVTRAAKEGEKEGGREGERE